MGILSWLKWRGKKLRPGEICPVSGQWRNSYTEKQATCVRGEPMPPGPKGSTWTLTDRSRHQE